MGMLLLTGSFTLQAAPKKYPEVNQAIRSKAATVVLQKEQGIAASIEKMLALGAGPHTLFVITNLLGVDNPERLLQVLNVARANHHQVQIHCVPDHVGSSATNSQQLESDLEELLREELHTRRSQTIKTLREGGIRVVHPRAG